MINYCKGKEYQKESANDDLDLLFEAIQLGNKPDDDVETYFLPMLTKKELELVEQKNYNYLKTFMGSIPDVNEAEMKLSESTSKFVYAFGHRRTFTINNWRATINQYPNRLYHKFLYFKCKTHFSHKESSN